MDGIQATSFKAINDSGTEWFLDFMLDEKVISRIRVQENFLTAIRDRLQEVLEEQEVM